MKGKYKLPYVVAVFDIPLVPLSKINQSRSFPYPMEVMQFAGIYPNKDFHQHQQGSFPGFSQSQQILSQCLCNNPIKRDNNFMQF